jgi:hypothetical protein
VASWRDKDQFKARVREWSDKLGVHVRSLAVRPMRNKWASRSTAGNLNFSDDLLALDRELTDYVIVHELLHFYVPNHGKLWKSLMRAHLGDYERAESKLKAKAAMLSRHSCADISPKSHSRKRRSRRFSSRSTASRTKSVRSSSLSKTASIRANVPATKRVIMSSLHRFRRATGSLPHLGEVI